jgi:hypothetical protein
MLRRIVTFLLLALSATLPLAHAQPPVPAACIADYTATAQPAAAGDSATLLRVANLGGSMRAVASNADGSLVAVGEGASLTLAQPAANGPLARIAGLSLPDMVQDIALAGSLAYVATGNGGLQVVDLANPAVPVLRSSLALPGLPNHVLIVGSLAYVASAGLEGGLLVLDLADPARPTLRSRTPVYGSATGVTVANGRAYVAAGYGGGLQIFDLPVDGPPLARGRLITPGPALAVAASSTHAYLAAGFCGIQTIDITNPDQPTLLHEAASGNATKLALAAGDTVLYVAAGDDGLRAFGVVSDGRPLGIERGDRIAATGFTSDFSFSFGDLIHLATGSGGLQIYNVEYDFFGFPRGYQLVNTLPALLPETIASSNFGTSYLLATANQLARMAASDPVAPTIIASSTITATIRDLARNDTLLVAAAASNGLLILQETSANAGPALQATLPITGSASAVALAGSTAYAALGSGGLASINVSNPQQPRVQHYVDTPGQALGLVISGTLALVADGGSLRAYDATTLRLTGVLTASGGTSYRTVALRGTLAYAAGAGGLSVIDVANPERPVLLGTYTTLAGLSLAFGPDERLVMACGIGGVALFDLHNPQQPNLVARRNTPGNALDLALNNEFIYVADASGGVQVLRIVELPYRVSLPLIRE